MKTKMLSVLLGNFAGMIWHLWMAQPVTLQTLAIAAFWAFTINTIMEIMTGLQIKGYNASQTRVSLIAKGGQYARLTCGVGVVDYVLKTSVGAEFLCAGIVGLEVLAMLQEAQKLEGFGGVDLKGLGKAINFVNISTDNKTRNFDDHDKADTNDTISYCGFAPLGLPGLSQAIARRYCLFSAYVVSMSILLFALGGR